MQIPLEDNEDDHTMINSILVIKYADPTPFPTEYLKRLMPASKITPLASDGSLHVVSVESPTLEDQSSVLNQMELLDTVQSAYLFMGPAGGHVRGVATSWICPT